MTDDYGLQKFLAAAADHRLLNAHEEKALGRRVRAGTNKKGVLTPDALEARNELVLCNIRLVVSVARYYRNRGISMADVVQEGIKGLHRAAEKFDPERGIRFSTYATLWIKQAIQRGLTSGGSAIRLPSSVAASRTKILAAKVKHPDADIEFLADLLDLDPREVERAVGAAEVTASLDREMSSDEHAYTLLDAQADPNADDPADVQDDISVELYAALVALEKESTDRARGRMSRRVLEMHFGLHGRTPLGVEDISKRLGITVNTVKTRQAEGLRFLEARLDHHR